jgi:hypothetical protein
MGNHWVWLERVDLTFTMMLGSPWWGLRLPAAMSGTDREAGH